MKQHIVTQAIVLQRTDFREADRILTLLTPDHGKIGVIAKGVRRARSKLAGGVELLSVSNVTILPGRGELGTLLSARLETHYDTIVQDITKTMLAYDVLKQMNRLTEDAAGEEYFLILQRTLSGLNELSLDPQIVEMWFAAQLLLVSGNTPNLQTDVEGNNLDQSKKYEFEFDEMQFRARKQGALSANHIKLLRLASTVDHPVRLKNVLSDGNYVSEALNLVKNILAYN
jgi:DNA repair protein RecO